MMPIHSRCGAFRQLPTFRSMTNPPKPVPTSSPGARELYVELYSLPGCDKSGKVVNYMHSRHRADIEPI